MPAELVNVMLVGAVVPPTAPPKEITPPVPAVKVKVFAVEKLIVLVVPEKLILAPAAVPPAFVVSNVRAPVRMTGPVIVIAPPLVVMFPSTLMAVEPV